MKKKRTVELREVEEIMLRTKGLLVLSDSPSRYMGEDRIDKYRFFSFCFFDSYFRANPDAQIFGQIFPGAVE